jgi:anti-sigma regulatory factor (Ser/Thr protein kinase)
MIKTKKSKNLSHNTALQLNDEYGSFMVLRHILSELTTNIYDHSSFEEGYSNQGYTYCQEYPIKNY